MKRKLLGLCIILWFPLVLFLFGASVNDDSYSETKYVKNASGVLIEVGAAGVGTPGASAYQVAVAAGYSGTVEQWLASLVGAASTVPGPQGPASTVPGPKGDKGDPGDTGAASTVPGPQGPQGPAGSDATVTKAAVEAVLTGTISTHTHAGGAGGLGYTLQVQALTSSPGDGATVYFGNLPKAPIASANVSKVYIPKAGTIKVAEIYCYSGTAGTNEAWSLYIRKNNTTDTLVATVSAATSERRFTNSALSISVVAGDYIEIKSIQPTWATNPLTCIYGGTLYIE